MSDVFTLDDLSEDKKEVLKYVDKKKNIFLTSSAGCGKTYLVNFIKNNYKGVAVTAMTGIAAANIEGITIHSWSHIGICDRPIQNILDEISEVMKKEFSNPFLESKIETIRETNILVIDEVSMMSDKVLMYVDRVCRLIKGVNKPLGGIQVILCGDLLQLPPILKKGEKPFYLSPEFDLLDLEVCCLKINFRQLQDSTYENLLNRLRFGELTEDDRNLLNDRIKITKQIDYINDDSIVKLLTHNEKVNDINNKKLAKLTTEFYSIPNYVTKYSNSALALSLYNLYNKEINSEFNFKIGARVMLTTNVLSEGLYNGSLGYITDYIENSNTVVVSFDNGVVYSVESEVRYIKDSNGNVLISITQIPLKLAYAITIHKSQGMTLERAYVDVNEAFSEGQVYVALSRIKNLNGLYIDKEITNSSIMTNKSLVKQYKYWMGE